jgi:hypothetical protein
MKLKSILALVCAMAMVMSSCKNDDGTPAPDPTAWFVEQLAHTWTLETASADGVDLTDAFPNINTRLIF